MRMCLKNQFFGLGQLFTVANSDRFRTIVLLKVLADLDRLILASLAFAFYIMHITFLFIVVIKFSTELWGQLETVEIEMAENWNWKAEIEKIPIS